MTALAHVPVFLWTHHTSTSIKRKFRLICFQTRKVRASTTKVGKPFLLPTIFCNLLIAPNVLIYVLLLCNIYTVYIMLTAFFNTKTVCFWDHVSLHPFKFVMLLNLTFCIAPTNYLTHKANRPDESEWFSFFHGSQCASFCMLYNDTLWKKKPTNKHSSSAS